MTGLEIFAVIYLALGTLIAALLIEGAEPPEIAHLRGTVGWWLGGMIAGVAVAVMWLPIILFVRLDDEA